MKVLLCRPRGFCAGVERAIETVERALDKFGSPVYVRHEIVHNQVVVRDLEEKGAVFVEDLSTVPEGSHVIFSAHGVAPEVFDQADRYKLQAIDATCPLVTKVHVEARRFAARDFTILLIGHADHRAPHRPQPPFGASHILCAFKLRYAWLAVSARRP